MMTEIASDGNEIIRNSFNVMNCDVMASGNRGIKELFLNPMHINDIVSGSVNDKVNINHLTEITVTTQNFSNGLYSLVYKLHNSDKHFVLDLEHQIFIAPNEIHIYCTDNDEDAIIRDLIIAFPNTNTNASVADILYDKYLNICWSFYSTDIAEYKKFEEFYNELYAEMMFWWVIRDRALQLR